MKKQYTLCLIQRDRQILLGFKKVGFGRGRWNGFGGKVEAGESVEAAARREVREEAGVTVGDVEPCGIIEFSFEGTLDILEVHIFRAREYHGTLTESAEMRPQWFAVSAIPFDEMWPDDRHWFPLFLAGKRFRGTFHFDAQGQTIRNMELREID